LEEVKGARFNNGDEGDGEDYRLRYGSIFTVRFTLKWWKGYYYEEDFHILDQNNAHPTPAY
jgi:hypothetical protein